jgi:signal transduction histidine kinase
MLAAATSRTARASLLFAAAFILVFLLISAVERLGHPHGGRLIEAFDVTFAGGVAGTAQTNLRDEFYRYASPDELRAARFGADITSHLSGLKEPALLITDAYAFVSVKLNGVPLSDQGGRDGPIPDRQFEPRLYYLSSALRGDPARDPQILTIDIRGEGRAPYLREVFLSETKDGILAYRMRRFVAIEGVVAATAIAIFAGLLSLAVTPLLEYRTLSGVFAFMMLLWALRNFTFVGAISDVPWPVQQAAYYASTFLILVTTVLLINHWTTNSRFIRRYFVVGLLGLLVLLYLPAAFNMSEGVAVSRQIGNFVGVGCFIMMIGQLIHALIRDDTPPWFEMFLFLACLSVGVIEVGGDAYPELTRWIWPDTGLSMAYGPLMPLPLAAGMLVNFVRRTVKVRDQLRMDNATLAGLVSAREAEIAKVYAEREAEVRRSDLMLERQRIMRDMHDGIGSQLLGLLFQARSKALTPDALSQGLQESLDDLNLVVESLDQSGHGLAEALGAFRARIAPKCESAGITLDWDVDHLDAVGRVGPALVLQVYRILQEACINAIRHGKPKTIRIAAGPDPQAPDCIRIAIEDDGAGFDLSAPKKHGRGLSNMRKRAQAAGGTLDIDSAPGRTRLTLRLPAAAPH